MRQHEFVNSVVVVDFLKFLTDTWTDGSFSHSWVSRSKLQTGLPVGQFQHIHSMRQALQVHQTALPHVPPHKQRTLAQHAANLQTQHQQLQQQVAAATQAVALSAKLTALTQVAQEPPIQQLPAQDGSTHSTNLLPYVTTWSPQQPFDQGTAPADVSLSGSQLTSLPSFAGDDVVDNTAQEAGAIERNFLRQCGNAGITISEVQRIEASSARPAHQQRALALCKSLLLHINFLLALHGHAKLSLSKSAEQLLLLPNYCYDLQAFMHSDLAELPESISASPWYSSSAAPLAALLALPLQLSSSRVTLGMALLVRYYWTAGNKSLNDLPEELRFSWQGHASVHNLNPAGFAVFPALDRMNFDKRLLEQQRLHWLLHAWQQQLQQRGLLAADLQALPAIEQSQASRYLISAALYTTGYAAWDIDYQRRFEELKAAHTSDTATAAAYNPPSAMVDSISEPTDADIQAFVQEQADIDKDDRARDRWLQLLRGLLGR